MTPQSLVAGLMWLGLKDGRYFMRHVCQDSDELKTYGWTCHNGRDYGCQMLVDQDMTLMTSFLKSKEDGSGYGGDWAVRIDVQSEKSKLSEEMQTVHLFFYLADEDGNALSLSRETLNIQSMDDLEVHYSGFRTSHIHNLSDLVQQNIGAQAVREVTGYMCPQTMIAILRISFRTDVAFISGTGVKDSRLKERLSSLTVCLLVLPNKKDCRIRFEEMKSELQRYTMVPASLYLGFSASIIWVAEGTYLTSTARSHAHDLNLEEGNVIGNFNGEFWGMFAVRWKPHVSFSIERWNGVCMLVIPRGGTTSGSGTTLLYIVFVCSMTLGTILMCFLQKRDAKGEETLPDSSVSFYSSIVWLTNAINHPPYCIFRLTTSICMAEYTKYIAEPALGESGVGGAMAVYGAFDAIFFRLSLYLEYESVFAGYGSNHLCVTSGVLGILHPFLMAVALGIGDGIFNTQLNALLGMLFKHDMEGAFAQLKVWQFCISVGGFLFLTLMVEKAFSCAD
ncbi:unnamed protein product [Camellia sinensis]